MQLFLKRPPEMLQTLKKLFDNILSNDNEEFDLKDRAVFYAKALQYNIQELKNVLENRDVNVEIFVEDQELQQVIVSL